MEFHPFCPFFICRFLISAMMHSTMTKNQPKQSNRHRNWQSKKSVNKKTNATTQRVSWSVASNEQNVTIETELSAHRWICNKLVVPKPTRATRKKSTTQSKRKIKKKTHLFVKKSQVNVFFSSLKIENKCIKVCEKETKTDTETMVTCCFMILSKFSQIMCSLNLNVVEWKSCECIRRWKREENAIRFFFLLILIE